jgi:hypothetical protein
MSIAHRLSSAGLFVITDTQAKHRKSVKPEHIVFQYFDNDDIFGAIAQAVSATPTPVVLILKTGQVMILTESSDGGIALQGAEDNLTPEQTVALPLVQHALSHHFEIQVKGTPKKKPKSKVASDAPSEPLSDETDESALSTPEEPEIALESELAGDTAEEQLDAE